MTSELVIFRAFLFIFLRPPDGRSEKKIPVNQLIKKSGLNRKDRFEFRSVEISSILKNLISHTFICQNNAKKYLSIKKVCDQIK